MSDRATIVTANILEAIAAPLRQRAQEAFERGVPENLLGLMHEELAGLEGEAELWMRDHPGHVPCPSAPAAATAWRKARGISDAIAPYAG